MYATFQVVIYFQRNGTPIVMDLLVVMP